MMDFQNVILRAPNAAHMSAGTIMQQQPHHVNSVQQQQTAPSLQYGSWETRAGDVGDREATSSPMSDHQSQLIKDSIERTLNFSTSPHDDEYGYGKKKTAPRDPMSHRIIEKRRRDRMNNCLADLSRLIPSTYLRKGRGRIEKTEIIEMAIKHIRYLQSKLPPRFQTENNISPCASPPPEKDHSDSGSGSSRSYTDGYKDCFVEVMQFLVDVEGFFSGEGLCSRLIEHIQTAIDRVGYDLDLRENIPADLLHPIKRTRDSSLESESRSTLRNSRNAQKVDQSPKINGHRSRALSQSDFRCIRTTSDYDSEVEFHASGGSSHNSCNSPNSSGNGSATGGSQQNQLAPEALGPRGSSQLREMLQTPFNAWGRNYRPVHTTASHDDARRSPKPEQPQQSSTVVRSMSPTSTSLKDPETGNAAYSFKRTIKERFKEELRRGSDPEVKIEDDVSRLGKRRPDSRSSGSNDSNDGVGPFDTLPSDFTTAYKRRPSGCQAVTQSSATIPIFALHSSGGYYVPSSISTNMIEFEAEPAKGNPSICHPVTINVNFSTTAVTLPGHGTTAPAQTMNPNAILSQFTRPMFLSPQQAAATFLQSHIPFMQGAPMTNGLPFVCAVPNMGSSASVIQSTAGGREATFPMRRGSLPVGSAKEGVLHYGFSPAIPQPVLTNTHPPNNNANPRTSPHILNLSQPHTRL